MSSLVGGRGRQDGQVGWLRVRVQARTRGDSLRTRAASHSPLRSSVRSSCSLFLLTDWIFSISSYESMGYKLSLIHI
eukprot:4326314-Prymnesium_polylepis.1